MTSTGPLVELTSPRRVPWSARWRGRTAVAPPPLPVRPRPPYYWFAENQEEQPSAFTTLPTPPIPRDTHFYPRDPAQTSRDPRDPTNRHPRLDIPHRPPASSSDLHSSIHNQLLPTRLATPLRRPVEHISLPASLLQESARNSTCVSELDLASHCTQDKAVAVPALSKRREEGLRTLTGRVWHCKRYQLSARQA
jgi:hypothetical protein